MEVSTLSVSIVTPFATIRVPSLISGAAVVCGFCSLCWGVDRTLAAAQHAMVGPNARVEFWVLRIAA